MNDKINIAIDGYSSCGKSTLTKELAKELSYTYIDTGAMYRAVALHLLRNKISPSATELVEEALKDIQLSFTQTEQSEILLNSQPIEAFIRNMEVSNIVSEVAAIKTVREFLVKQQQQIVEQKGVIMDGRDIGTVVMPNAELKIFMTADKEVRVQRRYDELLLKGKSITIEEVKKNLEHRDYIDTHREESPLSMAEDAILLDNTNLSKQEQLAFVIKLVNKRILDHK